MPPVGMRGEDVVRNYYLLTGMLISILAVIPIVFYILPKQWVEVRRPKSVLTPTRISLFILEASIAITMLPGIPRLYQLLDVPPANNYAKIVAITNKLPYLIISVILLIIYRERID